MKTFLKVLLISAAAAGVALAGTVVVLKRMFPPEKIKALVVQQAAEKLHREVRLGEVRLGIFSGISIDDFALSEAPTFKQGTFVESGNFTLKFQLAPLLKKKVVIDQIVLDAPKVRIIRERDGKTFNFSDLVAASTPSAPQAAAPREPSGGETPMALTISRAVLSKGKIEFIDRSQERMKIVVSPIDLTVSGTGLDKPMAVDLAFTLDSVLLGKGLKGTLSSKAVVDLKEQRVDLEKLNWTMAALTLDLKGKVRGFEKPDLDLAAALTLLDLASLSDWVTLPKELKLSGRPTLSADLKGTPEDLSAALKLDLSKTAVGYADLFQKDDKVELWLAFKGRVRKQESASIESIEFKAASLEASVQGAVERLKSADPELKLQVKIKPFELKDLAAMSKLAAAYRPSGKLALDASVSGTSKSPQIKVGLQLDGVGAQYETYLLQALTGRLEATGDSAEINSLSGNIAVKDKTPAEFKIKASVRHFKQPEIVLNADFSALDLTMFSSGEKKEAEKKDAPKGGPASGKPAPAAPYKGPEIKAEGRITVGKFFHTQFEGQNLRAAWKLTGVTPVLDRMNGTFEMETGQGTIHKTPLLSALAPVLKLDPSGMVYSRIAGHWNIVQGTARTEDFQINSSQADFFAKGSVHLPTSKPDLSLVAKLPAGSIGGTLGELSNDEQGRPTFAFRLKGDWKPAFDASQVQKRAVEKATEEIKKKGTDFLQKEGQKLLDGFLKR